MSDLKNIPLRQAEDISDQMLSHKAGGTKLSSYGKAVVLLDKKGPSVSIICDNISCEAQEKNELITYSIKVNPGTLLTGLVNIQISFEGSDRVDFESTDASEIFIKDYSETSKNLVNKPSITVTVTGRDLNDTFITYTRVLKVPFSTDCDNSLISCTSNSSQVIVECTNIKFPCAVRLLGSDRQTFQTLQELVDYFNSNNIAINFYKKV